MDQVKADLATAPISEKLKALLVIAGKVQQGGRRVSDANVARARAAGADDKAIHDTVLIAAAFCMYNRYVDGLATLTPTDPAEYDRMGEGLARHGYARAESLAPHTYTQRSTKHMADNNISSFWTTRRRS